MEPEINKQKILKYLEEGKWILDDSSSIVMEKIRSSQSITDTASKVKDECLKNYAIHYYCKVRSPLTITFYDEKNDEKFNHLVLDKIEKEGGVHYFTNHEQNKIIAVLGIIKNLTIGHHQFIKDLSFIKMNSLDFKSASNPHLIGAIVLTNQINYDNSFELSKSIVHELAHQELFLINFFDRLILEGSDGVNVFSPYQKVERPPIGRLHSLWALFRMIRYGQQMGKSVQRELALFKTTIKTLDNNIMTDFGMALIENIRDCIEDQN